MPTMLEQAIAQIKAGEIEKAKPLLIDWLKQNPNDENGWLWMVRCVTDTQQQRYCLAKVLKINPQNQYALRSLRHLTIPVSPSTQPKPSQPPPMQPVQKRRLSDTILTYAMVAIAAFLVVLFVYAWWIAR